MLGTKGRREEWPEKDASVSITSGQVDRTLRGYGVSSVSCQRGKWGPDRMYGQMRVSPRTVVRRLHGEVERTGVQGLETDLGRKTAEPWANHLISLNQLPHLLKRHHSHGPSKMS